MQKEINIPAFETIIDGKPYVVTLHYPENSKVNFNDIVTKMLREDVKKAIQIAN